MTQCEFIENCPVFEKCHTGVIKGIFHIKYCKGSELENCARRILRNAGKEVPISLLPNGEHLESLRSC
ncbi:MAG: hypothetical protein WDA74_09220 [Spirochaetota bacterium]